MTERDDERHDPDELAPDAPASSEELAAALRLRSLLEGQVPMPEDADGATTAEEIALALRAAYAPTPLSLEDSRALFDATPEAEELALATELREALAGGETRADGSASASLAFALRAAFQPSSLDASAHAAVVETALASRAARPVMFPARPRASVVRVAFGMVAGGLALAASVVFAVTWAPSSEAPLARARTTQALFSEPFRAGEASARLDRIASARGADFRDNRFHAWGVR
jgi:hypothetical protein